MLNRFMISVAALALVAGTGLANAQDKGRDSGGAGSQQQMQHSQPSGGAAERGSMGRDSAHEKGTVGQAGGAGSMKSDRAADDKSSGAMKDEHRGREMNKNAAEDKAGATKGQRTDERAQGQMDKSHQDKSKSMSQDSSKDSTKSGQRDKDMKAEGSKSGTSTNNAETQKGSTSTNQNAQGQTGTSTNQNAQGQTSTSTTVGQAGAGAKLSTEQRTQITSVIREQRVAPVTNVNFAVSVGTRIPREGIELHALPSRVVTIYPEWRTYRYVMVREQIVIIDPNTYEIIAILDV
ncbi:DUF1236 domain-containing protein [Bradyrhizobium iriomotense]|uniref:DUF1236 domain-containing protein n=1 Tax=Bradyrhizobium iriomotense TaxID=441950 RepID=UPI001B8A4147|nr:DUF1236 domain-containing protein [Bradyrhizobium iriomotense]MBR0780157.1 DUF1236 domain-containing protein [Bradyrhizobium iriomotense]